MTTLYNAVSTIDREGNTATRITKFTDGEVESSYLTTRDTCECPAGQRPTCRHRQMLPFMLGHKLVNAPYFVNWDGPHTMICDFEGHERPAMRAAPEGAPAEPAMPPLPAGVQMFTLDDPAAVHNAIADAVGEPEAKIKPAPFIRRI